MLELRNKTPFLAAIVPGLTREGSDIVTIVVKGTFSLKGKSEELRLADEQVPLRYADSFHGEPGKSSPRHEADTSPAKKRTDVVLIGHAYAPKPTPTIDVSLQVGRLEKTVRAFGDRVWHKLLGAWKISDPVSFDRIPLVYERSFGGIDTSDADPARHERESRNPVGTGFTVSDRPERLEQLRLPSFEDPNALIGAPTDRPAPAGFGFIGRNWTPRSTFAGTYDESWREERCPLLPNDFDDRYFQAASAGLTTGKNLLGGEPVKLENASSVGEIRFWVPRRRFEIKISMKDQVSRHTAVMDTLCIEPDERRAVITWKTTLPCPRKFLFIDYVKVTEQKA